MNLTDVLMMALDSDGRRREPGKHRIKKLRTLVLLSSQRQKSNGNFRGGGLFGGAGGKTSREGLAARALLGP
jgi:hypothetical protein